MCARKLAKGVQAGSWPTCRELEQLKELNRRLSSSTAEGPAANGISIGSHTPASDAAAAGQAVGAARDAAQKAEARAQQAETQATAYQEEAKALQGLSFPTANALTPAQQSA